MKKITKILALVLCMMMLATSAMAACSLDAYCPLVEEPAELTFWTTRMASVNDFETQTMTKIMEEKTGVHINWEQVALEEKDTKLNLSIAGGEYPDVYMTGFSTQQIMEYAGDVFIPLEDYITPEIMPNLCKVMEENPSLREMLTAPDGHIYTLTRTDVGVHMLSKYKMFVNTEWFNAYVADGGKMPETWEEFEAMLAYFRDNDMNGNGDATDEMPLVGSTVAWGGDPMNYLVSAFQFVANDDELLLAEDGQLYTPYTTDAFREGLKWMNHLYEEGLLMQETYVQDNAQANALINIADPMQQIVGVFPAAWQGVYIDKNIIPYASYTVIPPIAGPDGLRVAPITSETGVAEFVLQCAVTTACEDVELAMRYLDLGFVEYVPGDDFSLAYGQEGVSYKWSTEYESMNGLTPTRLQPDVSLPAVQSENWNNHTMPSWDTTERRYNTYADGIGSDLPLWEGHVAYEPYYKWTGIPLVTWSADPDLATEMNELGISLSDFIKGSIAEFVTGVQDIEDDGAWEAYLGEIDGIGMEDYIAGRQIICFGE